MTTHKLGREAFEAQFPNHDHYVDSDDVAHADPEWYEIPKPAPMLRAAGGPVVDKALALVRGKRSG